MATEAATRIERGTLEERVLEVVQGLVTELGGAPARGPVRLEDCLDRDLAMGSLERVELFLRLEEALDVRLGESAMAEAERVRDLVDAVRTGAPVAPEPEVAPAVVAVPRGAAAPAPESARTLAEVLAWHVDRHPERVHVLLLDEDGRERPLTYGQLQERAQAVAAGLLARGFRPGETVALMLRTEESFFPVFFGILLAGGIPVPIYPPFRPGRLEEYAERQLGILGNAGVRWLVTFARAERVAVLLRPRLPSLTEVTTYERLALPGARGPESRSAATDPALIQYTSGSTGDPKGVLLTHANLLANIRGIGRAIAVTSDDLAVSWLPLYHDMGLIGVWLGSLYFGTPAVLLSPLAFLTRPARWLRAISAHRATLSAAPNFAFDLCVRRLGESDLEGLDLRAWRLAMNGSEPVSADTIERFTARFARCGFRREAMSCVYGLAESAVGLTFPPLGMPPRVDRIDRETFQRERRARTAPADDASALKFVSCGRPLPEHEVRIVDRADRLLPERVEGHVHFRGPSMTSGYYRNPRATRAVLHDGWMDTGDLGYWADGELFVTGRSKDVVIKAGRNLYPQEVEEIVGGVAGIRPGCVAAFGLHDPAAGTERLVVVAESREAAPARLEVIRAAALDRIVATLGIPADVVEIHPPGAVPRTSSGKVRRTAAREAYLAGSLGQARPSARAQLAHLLLRNARERLARGLRRAGHCAYGAYVGTLLLLTWPALWGILLVLPRGRRPDQVVRGWCRMILALAGCPLRVEGLEHLVRLGPAVLVANHSSYLDVVALLAAVPVDFRFIAKRELGRAPLIGTVIDRVGHLTVDRVDLSRSVADAERASAALKGGASLLFFPEGTFVLTPGILPFRLGAFKAAVETGRPVVPVVIRGTREILPAYATIPRRAALTVAIDAPIPPTGTGWREMVRLRDEARAAIVRRTRETALDRRPAV
jgi:1-acyl-sn-glycerol-3-phosphate acyltransferase